MRQTEAWPEDEEENELKEEQEDKLKKEEEEEKEENEEEEKQKEEQDDELEREGVYPHQKPVKLRIPYSYCLSSRYRTLFRYYENVYCLARQIKYSETSLQKRNPVLREII